jgi:hypothetical protein
MNKVLLAGENRVLKRENDLLKHKLDLLEQSWAALQKTHLSVIAERDQLAGMTDSAKTMTEVLDAGSQTISEVVKNSDEILNAPY